MIFFALLACGSSQSIDDVGFLVGEWEARDSRGFTEERWIRDGETLVGAGHFTRPGASIPASGETLRIVLEGGKLVYRADPGTGEIAFTAASVGPNTVTFENLAHDFPQRISYTLEGEGLKATIEGPGPDGVRAVEWTFAPRAKP